MDGTGSQAYQGFHNATNFIAGTWGDATDYQDYRSVGVIGTADNSFAGFFENISSDVTTLVANNDGAPTGGLFTAFVASNGEALCGIGGGNLSCTGQVMSMATNASGQRKVETYAMQSPENWIEDFGSGELHGGSGIVTLDPVFADTVSRSTDYHVFLTPRGDSKGLYVASVTATSFEVRESGGGTASIGFDYRIVAKRNGYEAQRFTDVTEKFNAEMARN